MFSTVLTGAFCGIDSYLVQVEVDVASGLPCMEMIGSLSKEAGEAKERSGTLITVDFALEQGREVFVLPGRITDSLSAGCNRLLRQGAGIALSPSDILTEMSRQNKWQALTPEAERTAKGKQAGGKVQVAKPAQITKEPAAKAAPEGLSEWERKVWELLDARPQSAQELYERLCADMPGKAPAMSELTNILMKLILGGWAGWSRGSTYVRTRK